eukprot:2821818-Amphidinium_carterae.1
MAGPLRRLMEVASLIKKGRFKPDLTRSGDIAGEVTGSEVEVAETEPASSKKASVSSSDDEIASCQGDVPSSCDVHTGR